MNLYDGRAIVRTAGAKVCFQVACCWLDAWQMKSIWGSIVAGLFASCVSQRIQQHTPLPDTFGSLKTRARGYSREHWFAVQSLENIATNYI